MSGTEKMLSIKRKEYEELKVPEQLENRLRGALTNHKKQTRKKTNWNVIAVALIFCIIIVGFQFDALAYYGKKLVGYDVVMNSTLSKLNELGKGQNIGKSYTFKNGVKFTLEGIMLDDNQFIAFYTMNDPKGHLADTDNNPSILIRGMIGSYPERNSGGIFNDSRTEVKSMATFKTPFFFEKNLKLEVKLDGTTNNNETGEIDFTLDRNKAMGHSLKKTINKSFELENSKIHLDSILASSTSTVIKGSYQNLFDLVMLQLKKEELKPDLEINLIANGKNLDIAGSESGSGYTGRKFRIAFDALPADLKKLQIELVSKSVDYDVNENIKLEKSLKDQSIIIKDQNIKLNRVFEENKDTYITFTTEKSVVLSKVYLNIDDKKIELENTIPGKGNTRTMHFKGTGNKLELNVEKIRFNKETKKVIDLPIR